MADYTRYTAEPEDIPRRRRERKKKQAKSRSRVWLVVKLFIVALLLSLIAGLAVAAGAIYALSRDLPSLEDLRRHTNAVNTVLYDRTGKNVIAELHGAENRVLVPSNKIPEVMKNATVAVEDERFYEHHGVDYMGVARAMVENLRAGGIVQGGSTITEQYVKNAYVGDERSYKRKIREAVLAWQLEDRWSKDKILTEYLNTVYYGAGAYGVEAAARTYFHKHASHLNLKEAALLAALPKFPSAYSPTTDKKMATEQRNKVLQLMADQGYTTQEHADKLMASTLKVYKRPPNLNKSMADYFVDYVTRQLTKRYGSAMVFEGGLKVVTSIDLTWQQEAIDVIKSTTEPAGLRLQAVGGAGRHRPGQRLHPHHGRRPRLQEAEVQPGLAGQAPAGIVDEALRAHGRGREGHGPGFHLLQLQEPDHHPHGRLRRAVGRQRRRPGRPRERLGRHDDLGQRRVRAAQRRRRARRTPSTSRTGWASPARWTRSRRSRSAPPASRRSRWPTRTPRWPPTASTTSRRPSSRCTARTAPWTGSPRRPASAPSPPAWPASSRSASSASRPAAPARPPARTSRTRAPARPAPRRTAGTSGTVGYTPNLAAAVWMGDAEKNSPMDGAYGGTYCAPMWAKFYAAALKDSDHPSFKDFPWTFSPWEGKMQTSPRRRRPRRRAAARRRAPARPRPSTRSRRRPRRPSRRRRSRRRPTPSRPSPRRRRRARPARAPKQVVVSGWSPTGQWNLAASDVSAAGIGSGGTGAAGAVVDWLAGLFGL